MFQHDLNKLLDHGFNPRDFEAAPQCLLKYMGMKQLLKIEYHEWIDPSVTDIGFATIFLENTFLHLHKKSGLTTKDLPCEEQ